MRHALGQTPLDLAVLEIECAQPTIANTVARERIHHQARINTSRHSFPCRAVLIQKSGVFPVFPLLPACIATFFYLNSITSILIAML